MRSASWPPSYSTGTVRLKVHRGKTQSAGFIAPRAQETPSNHSKAKAVPSSTPSK